VMAVTESWGRMGRRRGQRGIRPRRLLAGGVALGLVLAACGGGDDDDAAETSSVSPGGDGTPTAGSTADPSGGSDGEAAPDAEALTVGVFRGLPRGFDPAFSGLPRSFSLLPVIEPLIAVDVTTGEFEPNLAEQFEQLDETTYTFDLRPGVEFSDGSPLTIEDVVYSIELHLDPAEESPLAEDLANIESVEATGTEQITVRLQEPSILFLTSMSTVPIVKQSVRESQGDGRGTPSALPVGTGPYIITEFTPDTLVVLERNDGYWGEPAPIGTITLRSIEDENTALAAFRAGELDVVFDVPPLRSDQYEDAGTLVTAVDPEFTQVFFNRSIPPFDDVNVRRAIMHSIDVEGVINSVYGGFAQPHPAIVAQDLLARLLPPDEVDALLGEVTIPYDMDLAREALAQSSVPDGFEINTIVNAAEPDLRQFALAIQDNLNELGITLNFEEVTQNQYTDEVFLQEPHIIGFGISTYGFNSYTPFEQILGLTTPGFSNLADYGGPEIDELTARLSVLSPTDTEEMAEIIPEMLRQEAEDVVYGSVVAGESISAIGEGWQYEGYSPAYVLGPWFRQLSSTG
ncbi:MAG: ABC transporter substrate-binding protein, partial [Ilumatobacteraceae bacterium]